MLFKKANVYFLAYEIKKMSFKQVVYLYRYFEEIGKIKGRTTISSLELNDKESLGHSTKNKIHYANFQEKANSIQNAH